VLSALDCSRGYKRAREGEGPKSLMEESNGVELGSVGSGLSPLYGVSCLPFYRSRGRYRLHERERRRRKRVSRVASSFASLRRSRRSCR
jgi:hypothetical protein